MDELTRTWQELIARPEGPLAMRFYLQPMMALIFAVRDGIRDAKQNRPAYFWGMLAQANQRRDLMRSGWKSVGKIFIVAIIMDIVYQLLVLRGIRPVQTILVAVTVAIVPYVLLRGPVSRFARRFEHERRRKHAA